MLRWQRVVGGRVGVLVGGVIDLGLVVGDPHVQVEVHVRVLAILLVLEVLRIEKINLGLNIGKRRNPFEVEKVLN